MRIFCLTAGFVLLALLLVSGCVSNTADAGDVQKTGPGEQELTENAEMGEGPESMLPDGANIIVGDIVIENDLYHSDELMRFNVTVSSDIYLDEVLVSAAGISGKMNLNKNTNLTEGDNVIEFEFKLPRCNTCGGIRAGTHSIDTRVYYSGELVAGNSASVEIRQ